MLPVGWIAPTATTHTANSRSWLRPRSPTGRISTSSPSTSPIWLATVGYPESCALANSAGASPMHSSVGAPAPHLSAAPASPHNSARRDSCPTRCTALAGDSRSTDSSRAHIAGKAGGYVQVPTEAAGSVRSPAVANLCERVENPIQSTPLGYVNRNNGSRASSAEAASASGNHDARRRSRSLRFSSASSTSSSTRIVSSSPSMRAATFVEPASTPPSASSASSLISTFSCNRSHGERRRTRTTSRCHSPAIDSPLAAISSSSSTARSNLPVRMTIQPEMP